MTDWLTSSSSSSSFRCCCCCCQHPFSVKTKSKKKNNSKTKRKTKTSSSSLGQKLPSSFFLLSNKSRTKKFVTESNVTSLSLSLSLCAQNDDDGDEDYHQINQSTNRPNWWLSWHFKIQNLFFSAFQIKQKQTFFPTNFKIEFFKILFSIFSFGYQFD